MSELVFNTEYIPANELEVDPSVQRDISPARVKKIANSFAEHSLGILTVSRRESRGFADSSNRTQVRYVVLDGQTRLAAVRLVAGTADTSLPLLCQVYRNLSRPEEAEIFLSHNDRAAVRKIDRFRIALVAKRRDLHDLRRRLPDRVAVYRSRHCASYGWPAHRPIRRRRAAQGLCASRTHGR